MKFSIEIGPMEIGAIASALNADADGQPCSQLDLQARDSVLTRLVAQAAILHNYQPPAVRTVVARDYANWGRVKSRHTGR